MQTLDPNEVKLIAQATGMDGETAAHIARAKQAAAGRQGDLRRISVADSPLIIPSTRTNLTASLRAPEPVCEHCNGAKYYLEDVSFGHPNFGKLMPCVCLLAERELQRQEEEAQRLASLKSELGDALADRTFANYDPDWPLSLGHTEAKDRERARLGVRSLGLALHKAEAYAADPADDWLYLWGPPGTGKSHLAAAVAHAILNNPRLNTLGYSSAYYRSVPDMIDALREGYRAGDYDARVEAVKSVPILILDDLGTEDPTDKNMGLLFQIINDRDKRPNVTIITSNLPLEVKSDSRADSISRREPRIASRIAGRAGRNKERIVSVIADDYRAVYGRRRRAS